MVRERRGFELRAVTDGVLLGIAMPYGSRGQVGRFSEEFRPGSLTFDDVIVNVQHDMKRLLARTGAGLTLTESRSALEARIELPDTTEGRDASVNAANGLYTGLSIEFFAKRDEWQGTHRVVHEARLDAIAVCARPAYAGATLNGLQEMRSEDFLELRGPAPKGTIRWRSL